LTFPLDQAAASFDSTQVVGVAVRVRSGVSIADPGSAPYATDVQIDSVEDR
jgi:hypothetical protein